jgi:selenide,water dikinase
VQHPDLLVGLSTGDDAAVWRLTPELCVVQTVDFFPPIVDEPYEFGYIAAVNAFSDVYAMGGTPVLALNLVCFPEDHPKGVLAQILRGGADAARDAGVVIGGGHTVKDREPKYGMAVTGTIAPDAIITNAGARAGDALVLTKPLGSGIITTAARADATDAATLAGAVAVMRASNRAASEAMCAVGVSAATDVTGFGLLGHLLPMMRAAGCEAHLRLSAVPLLTGVRELAERGVTPGGTRANLEAVRAQVRFAPAITDVEQLILADAQTSGGLLISVPAERLSNLLQELGSRDVAGGVIGEVHARTDLTNMTGAAPDAIIVEP